MKRTASAKTIDAVKAWLGDQGILFFRDVRKEYGRINAVWVEEGGIPHAVHFREGMEVRNQLRSTDECKDWDAHDLDDSWVGIIEEAIK